MNKIDLPAAPTAQVEKLIEELCPQGVEFKALGDVVKFLKGKSLPKKNIVLDGVNKCIHYGELFTKYPAIIKDVISKTHQILDNSVLSKSNDVLMPTSDVTPNGLAVASCLQEDDIILGGDILIIRGEVIDGHFLSLFIRNNKIKILQLVRGSTVYHIYANDLAKLQIPIPPFTIQKEIVKILDNFTQLEAELEARKKQYEHYRDQLLMVNDEGLMGDGTKVESRALGEVCLSISAGGDLPKKYKKGQDKPTEEFQYPIYSNGSDEKALYGYTDNYKINDEAVTISARGTIGYHSVRSAKFTPIVRLITLIPSIKIITVKFLNYVLDITEIGHSGGSIPQLTVPNVKKIQIPIPPLSKQKEIVAILDKFDALVNDISTGLPAEIAARKKQYEYYRNQLLEFRVKS